MFLPTQRNSTRVGCLRAPHAWVAHKGGAPGSSLAEPDAPASASTGGHALAGASGSYQEGATRVHGALVRSIPGVFGLRCTPGSTGPRFRPGRAPGRLGGGLQALDPREDQVAALGRELV